ncbi:DNA-binding transcriptional regulator, PadR family [Dyella sp. OK004]|nr:DNA-binding transcriptional regulator, PadR family [Dyella sp. OK004]
MNVVRLLVLGVIRELGRCHGYAIRQTLDEWQVQTWTRLHSGSIYHALQQLTKEGLLESGAPEPGNRGPGKLTFAISRAGEVEFHDQLRQALASFDLIELSAGIAFIGCLPKAEATSLISQTIECLKDNADRLALIASSVRPSPKPPRTKDLLALWRTNLATTATSLEEIRGTLDTFH